MNRGKISVYSGRGMVIGCARAGKTTLVKKLKGEDMKVDTKSTSGIDIHTHAFKLSSDKSTIIGKYLHTKIQSLDIRYTSYTSILFHRKPERLAQK